MPRAQPRRIHRLACRVLTSSHRSFGRDRVDLQAEVSGCIRGAFEVLCLDTLLLQLLRRRPVRRSGKPTRLNPNLGATTYGQSAGFYGEYGTPLVSKPIRPEGTLRRVSSRLRAPTSASLACKDGIGKQIAGGWHIAGIPRQPARRSHWQVPADRTRQGSLLLLSASLCFGNPFRKPWRRTAIRMASQSRTRS